MPAADSDTSSCSTSVSDEIARIKVRLILLESIPMVREKKQCIIL